MAWVYTSRYIVSRALVVLYQGLAQFGRAQALEAWGPRFES